MRLVANEANEFYLADVLENIRDSKLCAGVTAGVAYVSSADKLIDFCIRAKIPLKLFCLCNAEAFPSPPAVKRILDQSRSGWQLWLTKNHYHPKLIWFRGVGAYIGSANLSDNGWEKNIEAGVFFDRDEMSRNSLEAQFTKFFEVIKSRSRPATTEDFEAFTSLSHMRRELNDAKEKRFQIQFDRLVACVSGSDSPTAVDDRASAPYLATEETIAIARKRYAEKKGNDKNFAGEVLVSDNVTFRVTPEIAAPLAFVRTGLPSKSRSRKVNGYRAIGETASVADLLNVPAGLNSLDLRWDYGRGFISITDKEGRELIGNPARDKYAVI